MQEVAIRRIPVPGKPMEKSSQDPISMEKKLGMVVYTYHLVTARSLKQEDHRQKSKPLSPKYPEQNELEVWLKW
jgi:hypothetical protein